MLGVRFCLYPLLGLPTSWGIGGYAGMVDGSFTWVIVESIGYIVR